jgi:exonuclease VII large subunit
MNLIQKKNEHLVFFEKHLQLADPQLRLKQGYSIIRDSHNKILKSTAALKKDDELELQFHVGTVTSIVKEIRKD